MTVTELILRLQALPNQNAMVHVITPLPTEMGDCAVTGIHFEDTPEDRWCVWIDWAAENCGSGMCVGEHIMVTDQGLVINDRRIDRDG